MYVWPGGVGVGGGGVGLRDTPYNALYGLGFYYSRTSLIRTLKGQSEVSVLERCP